MVKKFFLLLACLSILVLTSCGKVVSVTFHSNGGSSVPAISKSRDFDPEKLPIPTKEGHTFVGWFVDSELTVNVIDNVPNQKHFDLYAKWEVNTYYITYQVNGGSLIEPTSHLYGSAINPPTPTKAGNTFAGWFEDAGLTTAFTLETMPGRNLTLYAKWMPNSYTITFDSKGGSAVSPIVASFGSTIQAPPAPVREGYQFAGWFLDEEYTQSFVFTTMPLNGATLYAKWDLDAYQITFDTGLPLSLLPIIAYKGDPITLPIASYPGYAFMGWYLDDDYTTPFTLTTMPGESFTLYAKWQSLKVKYVVEHYVENANDDNYTLYQTDELEDFTGSTVEATKLSLYWVSEFVNHPDRVPSGVVLGDGSLVLKRYYQRNTYTITVLGNGGVDPSGKSEVAITLKYGAIITEPTFTRKGYQFTGWSTVFPTTMPTSNLEISCKWEAVYVSYKIEHYQENALDNNYTLIQTDTLSELIDHEVTAQLKNYLGFTVNSEHVNSKHTGITLVEDALVLRVYYKRNTYTITFKDDQGNNLSIPPIEAKFGSPISAPTEPTKPGFAFVGWFASPDATESFNFTTMPVGGVVLYAKFEVKLYTITFVSNAEIAVTDLRAEYNTPIQAPSVPIRQGYTFVGWYSDQDLTIPYVFTVMPAEDITLYAKWQPNQVTLTLVYSDGRPNTVIIGTVGGMIEPVTPERDGYTFDAWYSDANLTTVFDTWIMPTTSKTIYANWIPEVYTISFVSGFDDLNIDPIDAPYDSFLNLPYPTYPGYLFDGWYKDEEWTIPFTEDWMPLGDLILYAKWVEEAEATSIAYAISRAPGTLVTTKGIVYAKMQSPYKGFYIQDANNQIFIFAEQGQVEVGDEVLITGYFEWWNFAPMLHGVSNITVLSSGKAIKEAPLLFVDELDDIYPNIYNFGLHFSSAGLITNEDGQLYLVNPVTYYCLPITHHSYDRFDLDIEANQFYTGEFILSSFSDTWELAIVDGTLVMHALTDQDIIDSAKQRFYYLVDKPQSAFKPLFFPTTDYLGLTINTAQIKSAYQHLYDSETGLFVDTGETYVVEFDVLIEYNGLQEEFTISVTVEAFVPTPIEEFIYNFDEEKQYYLQGIVIRSSYNEAVIQDATGLVTLEQAGEISRLELGSEVLVLITDRGYYRSRFELIKVVSVENAVPKPIVLTEADLITRQATWNELRQYEYVELKGYFFMKTNEYYGWDIFLRLGETEIYVIDESYNLDIPFPFNEMEVIIRGYLCFDYDTWYLIFDDNRSDFVIPSYTDLELVTTLQQTIISEYQYVDFYSYQYFDLPSCHPILGGKITWKMAAGYEQYYNQTTKRFTEVTVPTPIAIAISISYNEVNINFTMNKTLYPEKVALTNDLALIDDDTIITLKGLVIYRHFDYFYLMDDTGIVYVQAYDNYVQKGDYIRLIAEKDSRDYMPMMVWDEDEHTIDVLSEGNPVEVSINYRKVSELALLDPEEDNLVTKYYELTGTLVEQGGFRLKYGIHQVMIEPADDYTYYELREYLNKVITIRCYLEDFDDYYYVWTFRFTGLIGEISETSYTEADKMAFVKAYLYDRYDVYYASDNPHQLETFHSVYNATIEYQKIKDDLNCFDMVAGYINPVEEVTTVEFEVTITVGSLQETITVVMLIEPKSETGTETPKVATIAELKQSNGELLTIYAKIIEVYNNNVLVQDDTGMIFVNYMYISPYYYSSYVNSYYQITGYVTNYRGRLEMIANSYSYFSYGSSTTVDYVNTPLVEIVNYDHWDDRVFGKPVSITGTLIYEYQDYNESQYYITNGFDKVRLDNLSYIPGPHISNYIGLEVTVVGRIQGLDRYSYFGDYWTVKLARVAIVANTSDDEAIVDRIGESFISEHHNRTYRFFDSISFNTYYPYFANLSFHFEVISGNNAIDFYDNYGTFYVVQENQEISFKITITKGEVSKEFYLTITLEGIEIANFEDIFIGEGTKKLYLVGTLIHITPDGGYFLIDGNVYFLANVYIDRYEHSTGNEYLLSGYRSEIDGKTNLRFQVSIDTWLGNYYGEYPEGENYTIQEVYQAEPFDLARQVLLISGTLKYEPCSDMYYLENLGEKVYLRFVLKAASFARGDISIMNGYMPEYLINEQVIVRCLFPAKLMKGKYLLDVYGEIYDAIREVEYSPTETLNKIVSDLDKYYQKAVYYSFDSIWLEQYLRNCELTWELINPEDEQYFYYDEYDSRYIKWLEEVVKILYNVTITYQDDGMEPISLSTTVELTLKPRDILTLSEVYRRPYGGDYVAMKGIIQEVQNGYDGWFVLKDETGLIFVNIYNTYFDGVDFEVGDEVIVYGYYRYDSSYAAPQIDFSDEIVILSRGNEVSKPAPITLSIEEVFALDYLDPYITGMYIATTGTVVRTGSSWYGYTYYLEAGNRRIMLMPLVNDTVDGETLLIQNIGQTITISGYLYGLSSSYSYNNWYMSFSGAILTPTN